MALSMNNCGKYLSKRWHDKRADYKDDPEAFGDDEKAWLEVGNIQDVGNTKKENWLIETQPIDASYYETKGPNIVDLRDIKNVHQGKEEK